MVTDMKINRREFVTTTVTLMGGIQFSGINSAKGSLNQ